MTMFRAVPGKIEARMVATTLVLETLLVLFAVLAGHPLVDDRRTPMIVFGGLALAALCCMAAGMARRPGGSALAWLVQGVLLAACFVFPPMWVMVPIFVLMFWWLWHVGRKIDRETAQREAAGEAAEDVDKPAGSPASSDTTDPADSPNPADSTDSAG